MEFCNASLDSFFVVGNTINYYYMLLKKSLLILKLKPSLNFAKESVRVSAFSYKQHFFSTHPQCWLIFSWTELQMLLRCCLILVTIVILRHILYLVYLCPCLSLGLFTSYLCDLLFSFSLIFISVNHRTLLKQTNLFFAHF